MTNDFLIDLTKKKNGYCWFHNLGRKQVQGISESLNHYLGFISAPVGYKRIERLTLFSLKDKQGCCSCNTDVCQKQGRGGAHRQEKAGWI